LTNSSNVINNEPKFLRTVGVGVGNKVGVGVGTGKVAGPGDKTIPVELAVWLNDAQFNPTLNITD